MTLRIKEIMQLKGMKQARLAEILEVSPGYLSLIANNQRDPSPSMLARIAEALEVGVPDLFINTNGATGFSEPSVQPVDMTRHDADRLCRALGVTAKHPTFYDLKVPALAFGMFTGDRLAVDLNGKIESGAFVIATTAQGDSQTAQTGIYRWLDPWLEPAEPLGKLIKMDSSGDVAILGKVCGIARAL